MDQFQHWNQNLCGTEIYQTVSHISDPNGCPTPVFVSQLPENSDSLKPWTLSTVQWIGISIGSILGVLIIVAMVIFIVFASSRPKSEMKSPLLVVDAKEYF